MTGRARIGSSHRSREYEESLSTIVKKHKIHKSGFEIKFKIVTVYVSFRPTHPPPPPHLAPEPHILLSFHFFVVVGG